MHFSLSLTALLVTASLTGAGPTAKKHFSVTRVKTNHTRSALAAHIHAYNKYGLVHPAKARTGNGNSTATVGAEAEQHDRDYLCPVTIGKNTLILDFDTGSSDFCVFSTVTPDIEKYGPHALYDASTGIKVANETFTIVYADGAAAMGLVYTDTVAIGGVTIPNVPVQVVTNATDDFAPGDMDGMMGLGYQGGNNMCKPRQCKQLLDSAVISEGMEAVFTADLQPDGGSYDFGYIDPSKYVGEVAYTPILGARSGSWDFAAGSYFINGKLGRGGYDMGYAIMDTGTSLLYLQEDVVREFYEHVPSARFDSSTAVWTFHCSETPPDFSVKIAGVRFVVPGKALIYAPAASDDTVNCMGGIQSMGKDSGSIFGDVFMKHFFVIFDANKRRIGVAKQR